jgi:hypothetical protein
VFQVSQRLHTRRTPQAVAIAATLASGFPTLQVIVSTQWPSCTPYLTSTPYASTPCLCELLNILFVLRSNLVPPTAVSNMLNETSYFFLCCSCIFEKGIIYRKIFKKIIWEFFTYRRYSWARYFRIFYLKVVDAFWKTRSDICAVVWILLRSGFRLREPPNLVSILPRGRAP